jgi:hypothetical protein
MAMLADLPSGNLGNNPVTKIKGCKSTLLFLLLLEPSALATIKLISIKK